VEPTIDLLIEATLHGVVAALAVELIVRRLRVLDLAWRARLRLFVLVLPVVSVPLFHLLVPARRDQAFADIAIFASARWNALGPSGWPWRDAVFALVAALGLVLLLRDAVRDAVHAVRRLRDTRTGPVGQGHWTAGPRALLNELAAIDGQPAPPLIGIDERDPVLVCRGILRPHIVISEPLVRRLRPEGLRGALAHELSHARHGDVGRGALMAVLRCAQWFNPVAQVLARRITQETEWRADAEAVALTGDRPALARALLETARATGGDFLGTFGRARIAVLEQRCRRLLAIDPSAPEPGLSAVEFATTGAAVTALAFFIR
jgi:Zn-dependent protease with chaperone function